jgi:hypothetical protein
MLFPTTDFAIFFAIAFTVNWLLNPYAGWWKLRARGDRGRRRYDRPEFLREDAALHRP